MIKCLGREVLALRPESAGHNLVRLGRSFGGPILTEKLDTFSAVQLEKVQTPKINAKSRLETTPDGFLRAYYEAKFLHNESLAWKESGALVSMASCDFTQPLTGS